MNEVLKLLVLVTMFSVVIACAGTAQKIEKNDQPAETKKTRPPITISEEPKPIAEIDPDTLKVTLKKGANPKVVIDQLVRAWSGAVQNLQACQQQAHKLEEKK